MLGAYSWPAGFTSFPLASEVSEGCENGRVWPYIPSGVVSLCQAARGLQKEVQLSSETCGSFSHFILGDQREPFFELSFPRKCGWKSRVVIGPVAGTVPSYQPILSSCFLNSTECLCECDPVYGKVQKDRHLPFQA